MRVANSADRSVGYLLNLLGIRVWRDRCQLISRNRNGEWVPIGMPRPLPVEVPSQIESADSDALILTAYQYDYERPGSDLLDVLSQKKDFDAALGENSQANSAP